MITTGKIFGALLIALLAILLGFQQVFQDGEAASSTGVTEHPAEPSLLHLLQISEEIYCGGEPTGTASFKELQELGCRTIVSVDGARPAVAAAESHGMEYVHIPIGYDGVTRNQVLQLAAVLSSKPGPYYVHCHHGKHRGPTAAAISKMVAGAASHEEALGILERAGTSPDYQGLWNAVRHYEPPTSAEPLPELVSVAEVPTLAAAMAEIDRIADRLEACQTTDWQTPSQTPDVNPAQQALLVKEAFRESSRHLHEQANEEADELTNDQAAEQASGTKAADVDQVDQQLIAWLRESEQTAAGLEAALRAGNKQQSDRDFAALQSQCRRCHEAYR